MSTYLRTRSSNWYHFHWHLGKDPATQHGYWFPKKAFFWMSHSKPQVMGHLLICHKFWQNAVIFPYCLFSQRDTCDSHRQCVYGSLACTLQLVKAMPFLSLIESVMVFLDCNRDFTIDDNKGDWVWLSLTVIDLLCSWSTERTPRY